MLYRGTDVLHMSGEELRALRWCEISLVFQQAMNALNPTLTVQEQLRDTLAVSETPETCERRAREAPRAGAGGRALPDRLPARASGGMRQRVVIAIALARKPRLLLMDEPTTALDVIVQQDILQRIQALQRRDRFSVILITHDLPLMLRFADRVAIMQDGEIVEQSPARTLQTDAKHPYTQRLLRSFPSTLGDREDLRA